jgi:hypothetical protein
MTLGAESPIRVTAFLIGSARARLGSGAELELDPAKIGFAKDGSSNYESLRTARLVEGSGQSWIVEASESDLFLTGARRPGGVEVAPPIVPTYDQRAASYGDAPSDATLALRGLDAGKAWVTRVAGIVPSHGFGDDVAVTLAPGAAKSPFLVATQSSTECAPTVPTPPPAMTVAAPPNVTTPRDPEPPPDPPQLVAVGETTGQPVPYEHVEVSGSCDGSPQSQPQESSDDSCSHSDSSSDSSSDDGCDSSHDQPTDQSDDGCDSSSSNSAQDPGGDGCDGGSQDSGQSSDGCDSSDSSSSSSSSDCAMARRPRRHRSRTSLVVWSLCAVLLPLRRFARKRGHAAEC